MIIPIIFIKKSLLQTLTVTTLGFTLHRLAVIAGHTLLETIVQVVITLDQPNTHRSNVLTPKSVLVIIDALV